MKIDASLSGKVEATGPLAAELEAAGYDGLWTGEARHEPFLQLLHAADATSRVSIGSAVAIAFARTPMTVAGAAYDLALYSRGRFILGLGSQVKPHITRRFSMPWSQPAARMREFVAALHAIWATWQDGTPLDFRGEFYTHTLMTPFFSPPAHEFGAPPVFLAAVGERMTEVAGELCDGMFFHPFTTDRYLRTVTLPALARGRERAGRSEAGFTLAGPAFICTGRNEAEMAAAVKGTKAQIAFYASTPAYRPVLELHGWGELQTELNRLSRQGRWSAMGEAVTDDILHAFAVVGEPSEVGKGLAARWSGVADRVTLYANWDAGADLLADVMRATRVGC
ncbi:MAG TPA: LLM class F420-dependent oxidoreductase [Acidimicrobiales bacterium]